MNLTLGPKHHLATILSVVSILKIGYGSMLWINMAMDVLSKKDMAMDQCWISVEITQFMAALLRLPKLGTDCWPSLGRGTNIFKPFQKVAQGTSETVNRSSSQPDYEQFPKMLRIY